MTTHLKPVPARPQRLVNLHALRALVVVAEQGSFAKAAAILIIDSSTASKLVKALEQQVGAVLLIRSTRKVHGITPAGEHVLAHARELLALSDALLSVGDLRPQAASSDEEPTRPGSPTLPARTG